MAFFKVGAKFSPKRRDLSELRPKLRSSPVGCFLALYRPSADGIEIELALHAAHHPSLVSAAHD
jgi:hypothetical protein